MADIALPASVTLGGVHCFTMGEDQQTSAHVALGLTRAHQRDLIRVSGGAGLIEHTAGILINEVLPKSLPGFAGAIAFGGTRTLQLSNPSKVIQNMQEAAITVAKQNPKAQTLGIVPRRSVFQLHPQWGMIISEKRRKRHLHHHPPRSAHCATSPTQSR